MDAEIIKAIRAGGSRLEWALLQLYKDKSLESWVFQHVSSRGGTREDAEEVFQDSLIEFIDSVREDKFKGNSTIKTYISGISKMLWMNLYRKNSRYKQGKEKVPIKNGAQNSPEDAFIVDEKSTLMSDILSLLGEKCRKILELFSLGYSMKEIASKVGLKNHNSAAKTKHQCHKKLTSLLKDRPDLLDQLNSY